LAIKTEVGCGNGSFISFKLGIGVVSEDSFEDGSLLDVELG
jgi:hypothetical protein